MIIPLEILSTLVIGALAWTAIAATILGILFIKDWWQGNIW